MRRSPTSPRDCRCGPASPAYVSEFLSSTDGLALVKAFTKIKEAKLRRRVVQLVEEIAGDEAL